MPHCNFLICQIFVNLFIFHQFELGFAANETLRERMRKFSFLFHQFFRDILHFFFLMNEAKFPEKYFFKNHGWIFAQIFAFFRQFFAFHYFAKISHFFAKQVEAKGIKSSKMKIIDFLFVFQKCEQSL